MRERIDELNFKERCARSIVKGYNVRYLTREEAQKQKDAGEKEKEPGQEAKKPGVDAAFQADERYADIPSSQYGTTAVEDPVTKEQIRKILGERSTDGVFEAAKGLSGQ